jgi:hypothetical protein
MHPLVRNIAIIGGVVTFSIATLNAQWSGVMRKVPLSASGAPNLSAPPPRLADGKTPDLSGIWAAEKTACNEATAPLGCIDAQGGLPRGFGNIMTGAEETLPMQPWAVTLVKERRGNEAKDDPFARCLPTTPPRAWAGFFLQKIIQSSESIAILDEYMLQFRQIFLDGRRLPMNPEPLFKGYSVGKWSADTLVVETVGFKDDGWLDTWGHPLTSEGRVVERIRRPTFGTLEVEITVDDQKAYTKPWSVTRKLTLVPDNELLEYVCNENEKSLQHMVGADAAR